MRKQGGRLTRNTAILATFLAGGLFFVACQDSETVAPDGATMSISANPAQVIVNNGNQLVPVTLIATVRDTIGVPLPGQDVRFTTTNGVLTPQASTPVTTDKLGNATAILNLVTQAPQVTATSGKATASLSLTVGSAAICFISLSPATVPGGITSCSDEIDFTALVVDCSQKPVEGVRVFFALDARGNAKAVTPKFTPDQGVTGPDGTVLTTLTFADDPNCSSKCTDTTPGVNCTTFAIAKDQSGAFVSNPVELTDSQ